MEDSTLGMKITNEGIYFTATGDAKQGEDRGFILGKAMMYEHIEKELLYEGLLTDSIRSALEKVRHDLLN